LQNGNTVTYHEQGHDEPEDGARVVVVMLAWEEIKLMHGFSLYEEDKCIVDKVDVFEYPRASRNDTRGLGQDK
jgi:hypothetical protein